MTERERVLKVLKGETPDRVPWFADLGHWFRAESGQQWDLFKISNCTKEIADLHRETRAGWYVEVGSLYEEYYDDGVVRERETIGDLAFERFLTPVGEIIIVDSDEVEKPIAVRYGWKNFLVGNLFNTVGLPASSFRTDNWEE